MELTETKHIQKDVQDMKDKVDKMFYALMGNEIGKDGGLVRRIEIVEVDVKDLKERHVKFGVYQKIIWFIGGTIGTAFIGYLMNLIFHHK